jgi:hypothetical protein
MDLITCLRPSVDGYLHILVITEYLSKYPVVFPLRSKTAAEVAPLFFRYISMFGCPKEIVSDNGGEFVNDIMKQMRLAIGIEHRVTSPYHPRTNGQVERFNKTLIDALECFAKDNPDSWPSHLDYIVLSYRTAVHTSTHATPFEILFGRAHNGFSNYCNEATLDVAATPLAILLRAMELRDHVEGRLPLVVSQVQQAQATQRANTDARKQFRLIETPLAIGDVVFTRVLTQRKKLSGPRFLGPYKIVKVNAGGNYVLTSPTGHSLRRPFPLCQLRLVGASVANRIWEQALIDEDDIEYDVDHLLDHRVLPSGAREYCVRWSGFSPEFDSWESESKISPDLVGSYWGLAYSGVSPTQL